MLRPQPCQQHQHLFGTVIVKFMDMLQCLHCRGRGGFALTVFMLPMKFFLCCSKIGFLAVRNEIVTRRKKLSNKTWNLKVIVRSFPTNTQFQKPELNCLEIIKKAVRQKTKEKIKEIRIHYKGGKNPNIKSANTAVKFKRKYLLFYLEITRFVHSKSCFQKSLLTQ